MIADDSGRKVGDGGEEEESTLSSTRRTAEKRGIIMICGRIVASVVSQGTKLNFRKE